MHTPAKKSSATTERRGGLIAKLKDKLQSLKESESGATAIEYGLIAAGIAIVIIVAVGLIGNALQNTFNSVADALN